MQIHISQHIDITKWPVVGIGKSAWLAARITYLSAIVIIEWSTHHKVGEVFWHLHSTTCYMIVCSR